MTDVQRWTERVGDAIDDVVGRVSDGVVDIIRTMVGAYEYGGVGEVGASAAACAGAKKGTRLGGKVWRETVDQEVTQVMGSFGGRKGYVGEDLRGARTGLDLPKSSEW